MSAILASLGAAILAGECGVSGWGIFAAAMLGYGLAPFERR